MAISLVSAPDRFQPAFNPIEFVFSSTNVTKCDFKFIVDVSVNNVFAVRLKVFADPTTNYGHCRIERILQDFLENNFIITNANPAIINYQSDIVGFHETQTHVCNYTIEVRESYNAATDCLGSVTTSSILYTSSTYYAWNGALDIYNEFSYDDKQYVASMSYSRFLTNRPKTSLVHYNANTLISFLNTNTYSPSNPATDLVYYLYDSNNVLLDTSSFTSITTPNSNARKCITFNLNPTLQFPTYINDIDHIRMYLVDGSGNKISEERIFKLDRRCTKYKNFMLHWISPLGGWESYHFNLANTRSVDISRKQVDISRSQTSVKPYDRGITNTSIDAIDKWNLNSNWLLKQENIWLEDLYTGVECFMTYKDVIEIPYTEVTGGGAVNFELDIFNAYEIVEGNSVKWVSPNFTYEITSGAYDSGHADLSISDGGIRIPDGTEFTYLVSGGSTIGMSNFGTGTITGLAAPGLYHTDIVATINVGAIITGTMSAGQTINSEYTGEGIITDITYLTTPSAGTPTTVVLEVNVPSTVYNGVMGGTLYLEITKTVPVVVTDTSWTQKDKETFNNIQYNVTVQRAYKKNIQTQ